MKSRLFIPIVLIIYAILSCTLAIWFHEAWRDEYQMWTAVLKCDGFLSFLHVRHLESHPIFWDLILFIISRFTTSFIIVQLINITFSVLLGYLILKYSPFHLAQKLMLLCSYYFVFEFNIIARSYSLGVFLLFLTIVLIQNKKVWWAVMVAVFAVNTNVLCAIIVSSMFVYFLLEKQIAWKHFGTLLIAGILSFVDIYIQTFRN